MPEIWLSYGNVETMVDVRAENLYRVLEPKAATLPNEAIENELMGLDAKGKTLILFSSKAPMEVGAKIVDALLSKGLGKDDLVISSHAQGLPKADRLSEEKGIGKIKFGQVSLDLGSIGDWSLRIPSELTQFDTIILVSETSFDPLFGFDGGPVSLLKLLGQNFISQAFWISDSREPYPGQSTKAAEFAQEVVQKIGVITSVETVSMGNGVSSIHIGGIKPAHEEATKSLMSMGQIELDEAARALIVSPGDTKNGLFLSSSLSAVWNQIKSVREGVPIALLAESSEGLGSEAIRLYSTGRLNIDNALRRRTYVEGLEDLVYLKWAQSRNMLIIASTLPYYYSEKMLGFKAVKSAEEAVNHILGSQGSRVKIHVIPKGTSSLLKVKSTSQA